MDCFFNAYTAHARHLGVTVSRGSRQVFYAMRSSVLPGTGSRIIAAANAKPVDAELVKLQEQAQKKFNKYQGKKRRGRWHKRGKGKKKYRTNLGTRIPEEDIDFLEFFSDENGLIDGIPWWQYLTPQEIEEFMLDDEVFEIEKVGGAASENGKALVVAKKAEKKEVKKNQYEVDRNKRGWGKEFDGLFGWGGYAGVTNFSTGLTPAAVGPWIAEALCAIDGLRIKEIEYVSWWNDETYLQEAETEEERRVIRMLAETGKYGKEVNAPRDISLAPAIYAMVSSKHAQFGTTVPKHGVCCMAIQLELATVN